jgi:hypothetical protein
LVFSSALGFNHRQFIQDSGLSDLAVGLSLLVRLGEFTIKPFMNCGFVFLESVNQENEFWWGISLVR